MVSAALIGVSFLAWFSFFWLAMSSGIHASLTHTPTTGEIIGGWGQAVTTVSFIAGWAMLAVGLSRRRRTRPSTKRFEGRRRSQHEEEP